MVVIKSEEKQRLLIVDDEPAIVGLLSDYFVQKGYQFSTAGNGVEALEQLKQAPATIVITDLMMPKMDGITLIKRINERWPETDIIAITGYKKDFSYTDVINAGASDFISKPFNFDELDAKLSRIIRERNLRAELKRLSIRDPLTDLYNRRYFDHHINEEMERAIRQGYPLFLMVVDIDGFKRVNDEFGHQAGDDILVNLANVLRSSTRNHVDIICRYGGDEFAIIVPQATDSQMEAIAQRMRNNYHKIDHKGTTLSIGVSCMSKECGNTWRDVNALIKRADDAMYAAKRAGGNRVVFYGKDRDDKDS